METFDIVIVGGGLIGCSIAHELAGARLKVLVLDKQEPGREASWAAAGMLSPAPDAPVDFPLVPLALASLALYPDFARAMEEESGKPTGYAQLGALQAFLGADAEERRDRMIAQHKKLGLRAEGISIDAARTREPSLGGSVRAAAFLPEEASIEPRLLMDAVVNAATLRGVTIRANSRVRSLLFERGRCLGVYAPQKIAAKHVVLAAGCFSAQLSHFANGSELSIPTRPVRGQMVALQTRAFRPRQVLRSEMGYLVPRTGGRVVAGSTIEDVGFEKKVTAAGISQILSAILELCPELCSAEVVETWSGLRPGTPDALPILGPTHIDGLLVATGHYRNGILLAPITARLIREWVTTGDAKFDAKRFSPLRFGHERRQTATEPAGIVGY